MLAKNKSGWTLLEYLDISESDIPKYRNITGAYAILMVGEKYVVGFNIWRNQWEFPSGGIEEGETARQAAIKALPSSGAAVPSRRRRISVFTSSYWL